MSKIDYQKLREIAEKTKIAGEAPVMPFDQRINALNDFMKHFSPDIALALLDELEAADNNLIDSECHVAELEEALRDKQALLEASEQRIAELESLAALQLTRKSLVVPDEMTPKQASRSYCGEVRGYRDGWNACRAAMLHGAEPVSQTYKSQHTQFEQVADLYEMQFDDGRTCAFHTDAQKAAQWLQACDGNRVQEYVKLERLRNALSGNSPVTPDGWVMVPKEPTQAMIKAWLSEIANFRGHAAGYRAALEAAPQEVNRG
ncbi:ead/Ea22-like family protein [Escherichia coli]